jgi:UDP-glucose 4-epimerase
MQISKVLIVGGAGFVGSHLVDVCLENGLQVGVYDNFSVGKRNFLPEIPSLQVIEGDILDAGQINTAVKQFRPDVVFHLAAIHHIPTCERIPDQALSVNIVGTQNVLHACLEANIRRVVFASTGALYDPLIFGPLAETEPVKAFDIYSISKLTCEHLLAYYSTKNDREVMVARLFNCVGRRETNSHLIPAVVGQLVTGKRQIQLGNLTPRRDYIHVEDAAAAFFALGNLQSDQKFDVFNVGTGIEHSVQELVETFADVLGEKLDIISTPELQRKVDRPTQQANSNKLQQKTGWKPVHSLKKALGDVWQESQEKEN